MAKAIFQILGLEEEHVDKNIWGEVLSSGSAKRIIEEKVLIPLENEKLAQKHGVEIPKTILLFGPPGTGKTILAKGIAGRLSWTLLELRPSGLGGDVNTKAKRLREIFQAIAVMSEVVVFIDEFDELALARQSGAIELRTLTNEFIRQLSEIRNSEKVLLICATNYIDHVDPAVLRPERFDLIIPVHFLDDSARESMLRQLISKMNVENVDLDLLIRKTEHFTAADLKALCQMVAHRGFMIEYVSQKEYKIKTEDFLEGLQNYKPIVGKSEALEFEEWAKRYERF